MKHELYLKEAEIVIKIIDIAIKAFSTNPPDVGEEGMKQIIKSHLQYKENIINAEPKFQNLASLRIDKNDVLAYFQETNGKTVEYFWKEIEASGINVQRVDKYQKIFKKGKITNEIEYDFVIDTMIPMNQEGKFTEDQLDKLELYINEFEKKSKPRKGK